jgi:cyclopropane-fatty-acyl-phospholipid synthase
METSPPPTLDTEFGMVQAHYDLSDEFFALFLDESMTYTCAYFPAPDTSLADAQRAKIDLSLDKCDLHPGQRLLEIGCGWGAAALRARERYGAEVIGLTLSRNQYEHCRSLAARARATDDRADDRGLDFRLAGWETFEERVDRILAIGAFEHFGQAKHAPFFERCRSILPPDGVMMLHMITVGKPNTSFAFGRFLHFLSVKIFPGSYLPPTPERVIEFARKGGFEPVHMESLRPHYARTLDCWTERLRARQARAVEIAGEKIYHMYIRYLTECAAYFRSGECNLHQFTLRVA